MSKLHADTPFKKNKMAAGFARFMRKQADGAHLQWVLGVLVALVVDTQVRAEQATSSSGEGLDNSKIKYVPLNSDGSENANSDSEKGDGEAVRTVLIKDSGEHPEIPANVQQMLFEIANASPAEAAELLEQMRVDVIARHVNANKAVLEKGSSVTVTGPKGETLTQSKVVNLDSDGEVYEAIRQAAIDFEGGQLGKGFTVSSAELNELVPLQFVDESDQEILWAKQDFVSPAWYLSPLALLGFAGGGGGGAAAAALPIPLSSFSGVLLDDAISGAVMVLQRTYDNGVTWEDYKPTVYQTTTNADGSFAFTNLTADDAALLEMGSIRIHALAGGIDSFTGKSVGEFYLQALPGQPLNLDQQIIVDPISTISALSGVSQSDLKTKLFGAEFAEVVFDFDYLAAPENALVQDGIRQLYSTLRALNEIVGKVDFVQGIAPLTPVETLTLASEAFVGALDQFALLNPSVPAIVADLVQNSEGGDQRSADLSSTFISSAVQFSADQFANIANQAGGVPLSDAEIARITQATINSAQQVTNTEFGFGLSSNLSVTESDVPLSKLAASGYLSVLAQDGTVPGLTEALGAEGQASFRKVITPLNQAVDSGLNGNQLEVQRPTNFGDLAIISNGNDQYYTYDVSNEAIRYLKQGQTRTESFLVTFAGSGVGGAPDSSFVLTFTIYGISDNSGAVIEAGIDVLGAPIGDPVVLGALLEPGPYDAVAAAPTVSGFGSYTVDALGQWSYQLNNDNPAVQALAADQTLVDQFEVLGGSSGPQTVTITIYGTNDAPIAKNDSGNGVEDGTLSVSALNGVIQSSQVPLSSDSDPDSGSVLTVTNVAFNGVNGPVGGVVSGTYGDLTLNSDGSYDYLANRADFLQVGSTPVVDTFTYTISDGKGGFATADLVINVAGVKNDAPVITLIANTFSTPPLAGAVVGTFTVSDAEDDYLSTDLLVTSVSIAPNSDPNGYYVLGPISGQVLLTPAGEAAALIGSLPPIILVATDSTGLTGRDEATPALPGQIAPIAVSDSLSTLEDTPRTITSADLFGADGTGPENDSDASVGGVFAGIKITSSVANGILQLNGIDVIQNQFISALDISNGALVFIPNKDFNGAANFSYQVSDGALFSNEAQVTVTVGAVNDGPIAINDIINGREDTALPITFDALFGSDGSGPVNDFDTEGNSFTKIKITELSPNGVLTLGGVTVVVGQEIPVESLNGSLNVPQLLFMPYSNFNGNTSFQYQVNDGNIYSNVAIATLSIASVNDNPTAVNDLLAVSQGIPTIIGSAELFGSDRGTGSVNDSDVDGGLFSSIKITLLPPDGTLLLNGVPVILNQVISYADIDANGLTFVSTSANNTLFKYTVNDGLVSSNEATVNITVSPGNTAPLFVDSNPNLVNPAAVASYDFSYQENQLAGAQIGLVKATDAQSDLITYSIAIGDNVYDANNNDLYQIDASTGVISLTNAGVLAFTDDFETQSNAHLIKVSASDGISTTKINVTLNELNVNDTGPVFVDPNNGPVNAYTFSYQENQVAGAQIATVKATDAPEDTITYSIAVGDNVYDANDNPLYQIVKETGVISLTAAGAKAFTDDFEVQSNAHLIKVSASDGINTTKINVTLNETNVNEAPVFVDPLLPQNTVPSYNFQYPENTATDILLGTVKALDPETTTVTYSIAEGKNVYDADGNPLYQIDSITGGIYLTDAGVIAFTDNFELVPNTHQLGVVATDATQLSTLITVNLGETGVNEAPVFVDPLLPQNTVPSYTFQYPENTALGVALGTVEALDPELSAITYSIAPGDNVVLGGKELFQIDSSTGVISLTGAGAAAFTDDFETQTNSHLIKVSASDGINTTKIDVTLNETNVNEAPVFVDPLLPQNTVLSYTFQYPENTASGVALGTVEALDPEMSAIIYSIADGDNVVLGGKPLYQINSSTGAISLTEAGVKAFTDDFETQTNTHLIKVSASDGTNTTKIDVTLNETNVNEGPVFNAPSYTFQYAENTASSVSLGTVKAVDPELATVTYSIAPEDNIVLGGNALYQINSSTGVISLTEAGVAAFTDDFEKPTNSHLIKVSASDGINTSKIDVTLNETNVNEAPVFDEPSYTFQYAENTKSGISLGTVKALDPELTAVTYSIALGDNVVLGGKALYQIDANTGVISLTEAGVKAFTDDFEKPTNSHLIKVTASDGTNTSKINVTLNETDVDEAPVFVDPVRQENTVPSYTFQYAENTKSGILLGTVKALDPEASGVTYSIALGDNVYDANNNSLYQIDASTGVISLTQAGTAAFTDDFEKPTNSHLIKVSASDGINTSKINVTLNETNVNEAPLISVHPGDNDQAMLYEVDQDKEHPNDYEDPKYADGDYSNSDYPNGEYGQQPVVPKELNLQASGTLTVNDSDFNEYANLSVEGVELAGTIFEYDSAKPWTADNFDPLSMFSLNPSQSIDAAVGTKNNINWFFNSTTKKGVESFDFLPENETLVLTYTVKATTSAGLSDTHLVTITIIGTDDNPILSADMVHLVETDSADDLSASGTLTISDVDWGADEELGFIAQENQEGEYGVFSIDENGSWRYISNSAHNEFLEGKTYFDKFDVYSLNGTPTTVTIKIDGSSATRSDAEVHALVEAGDLSLYSDHLTLMASGGGEGGTTLQTSLKELQKLGVDAVLLQDGIADGQQIDVALGEGNAFTGGLSAGMFDAAANTRFNLQLDEDQLGEELTDLVQSDTLVNLRESGLDTASVTLEDDADLDALLGNGVFENLQALDASLGVTLDVGGRGTIGSATVSDGLAHQMAQGGIDVAQADDLSLMASGGGEGGTTLQTSLKELQKLGVDAVLLQDGIADGQQIDVALGEGNAFTGGLSAGMFDAAADISFNLQLDQDQLGQELTDLVLSDTLDNLEESGLDTASVTLENGVNLDALLGNGVFENLQALDASLGVTLDVGGRGTIGSATVSDGLAHQMAEEGIDVAQADDLSLMASGGGEGGTTLQTSLKELQKLGVDAVLLQDGIADGQQIDVALGEGDAFTGGLSAGMFDAAADISFNLQLDQDQLGQELTDLVLSDTLDNLEESGLDTASVTLESGADLDALLGNGVFENLQALDASLDVSLDVGGRGTIGSATVSDGLAHQMAEEGIDVAQADDLSLMASGGGEGGTTLQTSLKELQKLGVDAVLLQDGIADGQQIDVALGEGDAFTGGLSAGMFDAAANTRFNLQLDEDQLGEELTDLVQSDTLVNLRESGLDTASVTLEDDADLDALLGNGVFENLQALDASLGVTLDVGGRGTIGSATVSDGLAHQMAQGGIDVAQADDLSLMASGGGEGGTTLQTSLKELQKLGVDAVLVQNFVNPQPLMLDLGDGDWNPDGVLPLFGDVDLDGAISAEEDANLNVTLNINSWDDLSNDGALNLDLLAALEASGIDTISSTVSLDNLGLNPNNWINLAQTSALSNAGLSYSQALQGAANSELPASFDAALQGIELLNQFTDPLLFGDLISALTSSGVADFVIESGSVEINDPLAAALVDAGMLQALPAANLVIDATASGNYLFTSLKALADLGVDHINTTEAKLYVDLGLPASDENAIADIQALLTALDPANEAKSLFGQGQFGVLVINNETADAINKAGGLDQDILQDLFDLGFNEIGVATDDVNNAVTDIVAQNPVPPVDVTVIGIDVNSDMLHHEPMK